MAVASHRYGQLQKDVHGIHPGRSGLKTKQRAQSRTMIGNAQPSLAHDLDQVALQHGDVHKLTRCLTSMILDDDQTGGGHFDHETEPGNAADGSPDLESVLRM